MELSPSKKIKVQPTRKSPNDQEAVDQRRVQIEKKTNTKLNAIRYDGFDPKSIEPNIERLIGAVHVPIGVAGPVKVHGEHAQGEFLVPFATTEGTLVEGYTLGMLALSRAGGINTRVLSEKVDITPVFEFETLIDATRFAIWIEQNFLKIKRWCEETTAHGKLLELSPLVIGRRVYVYFIFDAKDAMGSNMISFATHRACEIIQEETPSLTRYFLRSNLSADKKPGASNFIQGYGKEVIADCVIPNDLIKRFLKTTAEDISAFWHASVLSGFQAGTMGHNAQLANGLACIYIACGQDVAQIVNASQGIASAEVDANGDLYTSLRLPCLICGTVGGGTNIDSQRECLEIMGCHGNGKSNKFAEIVAATLLAGEISIAAALANGRFIDAHMRKRKSGTNSSRL